MLNFSNIIQMLPGFNVSEIQQRQQERLHQHLLFEGISTLQDN